MRKSPQAQKLRRAGLAGLATTALVVGASAYGITSASADSTFAFDRVAGHNRFDTSVAAAKIYGSSTNVILANGTKGHYPDALTANYLARSKTAPVLLTKKDTTPTVVSDYLKSSGVTSVTVIGDSDAVSAQQVNDLTSAGYTVNRLGGHNRYDTAKAVIGAVGGTHGTALLVRGNGFADAVAAGPASYAQNLPLAITKTDTLPQATIDALKAAHVTQVIIVGGTSAVSNQVVTQLAQNQITLKDRIDGTNRVQTATKLAAYETTNFGFVKTRVNVASGDNALEGADALSGGPVSGKEKRPLLITRDRNVAGADLTAYLKANSATLTGTDNHIFGDTNAVSDAVEQELKAAASGATSAPTITKADLTTDAPTSPNPPGAGTVSAGDVITLTFSDTVSQTNGLISLSDADGDTFQIGCATAANSTDMITDAQCGFEGTPGSTSGKVLTLRLFENASDTNSGGNGVVDYPATITAVTGVTSTPGNKPVDVADSADVTIG